MTTWIIIGLLIAIFIGILKVCRILTSIEYHNKVLYDPIRRIEDEIGGIPSEIKKVEDKIMDTKYEIRDLIELMRTK